MIYRLDARVIEYFCFPKRPMKGGDSLDFYKGGNLRKGGIDLEKAVYDSPYQICMIFKNTFVEEYLQTTTYAFFKLIL